MEIKFLKEQLSNKDEIIQNLNKMVVQKFEETEATNKKINMIKMAIMEASTYTRKFAIIK